MKHKEKMLQISSDYPWAPLYNSLFKSIEKAGVKEDIYVFVEKQFNKGEAYPSNVIISKCFSKTDRIIFHLKHLKVLKDIQEKLNIDDYNTIHAHSLFSNGYIAYKLYKKYNIPYIVAVRNTDVNLFFKKMIYLRSLGINILKNAKQIIFLSEPYKDYTIRNYIPERHKEEIKGKSIVIPNGIDEFWLNDKMEKIKIPSKNKINLVYVGTLDSNKNIETTTKACEMLIKKGYEVNYKIIGRVTNEKYNDYMTKYPFIEYIKHCSKEKLIIHYRNSDIFVMPSKHETFGLVYAEAMSQGLPVIYSRGQGFDGQFEEGEVGYSVQYDSAEEIVDRIKKVINNYEIISKRCISLCDKFNWEVIAKEYIDIYS